MKRLRTGRPARPVVLPALRPQAVGGDAALPAARHAVRRQLPARPRLRRRAVRRDAGASPRPSGTRRSTATHAALRRASTRTTSTTCPRCACCACAQAAFTHDRHGRARAAAPSSSAAPTPPTTPPSTSRGRRLRPDRRGRGDAGRAARARAARQLGAALDAILGLALRARRRASSQTPRRPGHQGPRRAAASRPGTWSTSTRYRAVWLRAPRLLLDEHGHLARLPVPLQLVRQADLGPALPRAQRRRTWPPRSRWLKQHLSARPHLVRRRHLRPQARLGRAVRRLRRGARRARAVQVPAARRPAAAKATTVEALRRAGAQRVWVGAESGSQKILDAMEKGTRSSRSTRPRERLQRGGHRGRLLPAVRLPGRDARGHRAHAADGARLPPRRHRHVGLLPAARHALLRRRAARAGRKQNWQDSDDLAMLYQRPVQHRLLPPAAPRAASRVPRAPRLDRPASRRCATRCRCAGATCARSARVLLRAGCSACPLLRLRARSVAPRARTRACARCCRSSTIQD